MNFWAELWRRAVTGWWGPYQSSDPALAALFGVKPTSSGVAVDEPKALTSSAVWACVQLIAGTMATLPLIHYRRLADGGKQRFTGSRLYFLLHDQPNDEMPAATWLETLGQHVLLWGNAFSEIRRDARGQVAALWPIEPWRVTWFRDGNGEVRYRVDGQTILRPEEMLHVPGLTPDGIWGYSPIQKAREALGLLLAAERFGGVFFAQGSSFGGILTHPGRLNESAEAKLRESLEKRAQGVDRAHNFIILQEGMRFDKLGVPPNDAQFLETRQFQLGEVARWFGVPPHMIGDVERSTSWGTGIEAQTIGFVTYTLRRWLVRFEQELMRKLISPLERNLQAIEFVLDGLLRGDTATRYNAYQIGKNGGWLSANDIRRLENMDPLGAQGDVYLVPLNMVPATDVTNPPEPPAPRSVELTAIAEDLKALREAPPPPMLPPPPPDFTPVLEKLEAAEQARWAQAQRLAATLPSLTRLIEDGATEIVRRETDRALRAAASSEKLADWIETFYPTQTDYALRKLRGPLEVYLHLMNRSEDADALIRTTMAHHVAWSLDDLRNAAQGPPDDLKAAIESLTVQWWVQRPAQLTRALVSGEGWNHGG